MKSFLFILMTLLSFGCTQKKVDCKELSYAFSQANKSLNMLPLYDIIVERRFKNQVDSIHKTNRTIIVGIDIFSASIARYVYLPIYSNDASNIEKKAIFMTCSNESKSVLLDKKNSQNQDDLFNIYCNYVDAFLKSYYSINTNDLPNTKYVKIYSNPTLGKFIIFKLSEGCSCYFVDDHPKLNPYWTKFFNTSKQISENWYGDSSK